MARCTGSGTDVYAGGSAMVGRHGGGREAKCGGRGCAGPPAPGVGYVRGRAGAESRPRATLCGFAYCDPDIAVDVAESQPMIVRICSILPMGAVGCVRTGSYFTRPSHPAGHVRTADGDPCQPARAAFRLLAAVASPECGSGRACTFVDSKGERQRSDMMDRRRSVVLLGTGTGCAQAHDECPPAAVCVGRARKELLNTVAPKGWAEMEPTIHVSEGSMA